MVLQKNYEPVSVHDFEKLAQQKLSQMAYDYYVSGATDEITLANNCAAYERILLNPKMLVDVSKRDLSTSVLGQNIAMPVMIAPTAFHGLACSDAELATTKAAGRAGTIMILSTLSNCAIEEVLAVATGPVWFQLYVYKDKEITKSLVARAEVAGCQAMVLTVDSPILGKRERDIRNQFQLPEHLTVKNLIKAGLHELPSHNNDSGLAAYISSLYDTSLTWKDLEWFRSITKLPILVKGILRADDAITAIKCGASGIIVSNHGGRQLDTVPATIDALPRIADAIGDKTELLVDGGIRRGTDVVKALALGAKAVLVGRPILWGLSAKGEQGVSDVLEIFRQEFDRALALIGCPNAKEISKDFLF